jgi:hypothetical protein
MGRVRTREECTRCAVVSETVCKCAGKPQLRPSSTMFQATTTLDCRGSTFWRCRMHTVLEVALSASGFHDEAFAFSVRSPSRNVRNRHRLEHAPTCIRTRGGRRSHLNASFLRSTDPEIIPDYQWCSGNGAFRRAYTCISIWCASLRCACVELLRFSIEDSVERTFWGYQQWTLLHHVSGQL